MSKYPASLGGTGNVGGLGFITQLPQQLPDEVPGLANNWVFHETRHANVVNCLRHSSGGINEGVWARCRLWHRGQAVVSFTSLARSLLVAIYPTPSKLLMVA